MNEDWEYILATRLLPYLPDIRLFWENVEKVNVMITGEHHVEGAKPNVFYRVTQSPARSPLKNIQTFPYIPIDSLGLTGRDCQQALTEICMGGWQFEEFTVVVKAGVPTMCQRNMFVAFIPTSMYNEVMSAGSWVYLTVDEMRQLCALPKVYKTIKAKLIKCF